MTDFYLVTGFLGAGKTTFMKQFLPLLAPRRLYLIINEFGKEGVDGTLLRDMGAVLAEINNGSIFCACRLDQFETTLTAALETSPDIIVTEASGLADPTNVCRVLAQFPQIRYKGSICLADARLLPKVYHTALVCQRQLAVSSLVLLNKTDMADVAQREAAKALIVQTNPAAHVFETQFGAISPDWLSLLCPAPDAAAAAVAQDITLQKACLCVAPSMPREALYRCLVQLSDATYRMKGFIRTADGCFFADCTGPNVTLSPWEGEANNRLVLLAGKGMPLRKAVKTALEWYGHDLSQAPETDPQEF